MNFESVKNVMNQNKHLFNQKPTMGHNVKKTRKSWPKNLIKEARKTPLIPILRERGYHLREMPDDNFIVMNHQDLTVKDFYWIWKSKDMQGNAIDFFMCVECRSFDEAMEILCNKL